MRRGAIAFWILALATPLTSGCMSTGSPVSPGAALHLNETSVALVDPPVSGAYGGTILVTWHIDSPLRRAVNATSIVYGPQSISDANVSRVGYPSVALAIGTLQSPGTFQVLIPLNFSTVFLRAFAVIDGRRWWSEEHPILVEGAYVGVPQLELHAPKTVPAATAAPVSWSANAPSGGVVTVSWRPVVNATARDFFAQTIPLNASRVEGQPAVVFPFPGVWRVNATLSVGSAIATWNATLVVVTEPAHSAVALLAFPPIVAPGERVTIAWHVMAASAPDSTYADIVFSADGSRFDPFGTPLAAANDSVAFSAPPTGTVTVVAHAVIAGIDVSSLPTRFSVIPGGRGTYNVTVVAYPANATAGSRIPVVFRADGPQGAAEIAAVHQGNESVPGPPGGVEPANYTGPVTPADSGAGYRLPGTFYANLTAPTAAGILYFRARIVVNGLNYWSDEESLRVLQR
ncbi:MAG: hypothetical protein ACYDDF_00075 [Thermoplasmatota archaeon]